MMKQTGPKLHTTKAKLLMPWLGFIALSWAVITLVYTFKFDKGSSGIAFMLLVGAYYIARAARSKADPDL